MRNWMFGLLLGGLAAGTAGAQELGDLDDALSTMLAEETELVEQAAPAREERSFTRQVERTPNNVFVITREQIEAVNPKHPAEMLRFVPGFVVHRRQNQSYEIAAFGTGSDLSNNVLALLDGHRITDPTFGNMFWHLVPLVQDDLERIEVTLGPESTVYGSNAFAAVVNFVTRSPEVGEDRITSRLGQESYHQVNWTHASRTESGSTRIMISNEHSAALGGYHLVPSGILHPVFSSVDSFTQSLARVQHRRQLDEDTLLRFSVGAVRSDNQGIVPGAFLQQQSLTSPSDSLMLTFDLDRTLSETRQLSLRGTYTRSHIQTSAPALGRFAVPDVQHSDFQNELDLRYRWEPRHWKLVAGVNHRSFGVAGPYNDPVDSQQSNSLFLHGEREIGEKFVLFLGGRTIDHESAETVNSWKVAGLYRPRPDLGFRASMGTSFREPDFVGLFFRNVPNFNLGGATIPMSAPVIIPNPGLESETAKGFLQLGVEKLWERRRLKLDFYKATYQGEILGTETGVPVTVFIPPFGPTIPVGIQTQIQNRRDQEIRGATLAFQQDLGRDYQFQLAANVQNLKDPNTASDNAYAPPRSATLMVSRPARGKSLGGSLSLTLIDRYGLSGGLTAPGYGMLDLNLERRLSHVTSLLLTGRNLLDKEHLEIGDNNVGNLSQTKGVLWGRDLYLTFRFDL